MVQQGYAIVRIRFVEEKKDGTQVDNPFYGLTLAVPDQLNARTIYADFTVNAEDADLSGVRVGDRIIGEFDVVKAGDPVESTKTPGVMYQNYTAYARSPEVRIVKAVRPKITIV